MGTELKSLFNSRLIKYLNIGNKRHFRRILHKFHRNYKIIYYKKKIIDGLIDTNTWKLHTICQKWISLPKNNKKIILAAPLTDDEIYNEN